MSRQLTTALRGDGVDLVMRNAGSPNLQPGHPSGRPFGYCSLCQSDTPPDVIGMLIHTRTHTEPFVWLCPQCVRDIRIAADVST